MSNVTPEIQDQVSELYIAFFNRAPDAIGFAHWAQSLANGATVSQIAQSFSETPEFQSTYGGLTPEQQIGRFYLNVLNREADEEGLAFWVGKLEEGVPFYDIAYAIVNTAFAGAGNPDVNPADVALVNNKVTVAEYFAIELQSNDFSAAQTAFVGVDDTQASVDAKIAELDAEVNVGATYTLTTGVDNITGTKGNDTFYAPIGAIGLAPVDTLQNFDSLDGGEGTDRLIALLSNDVTPAKLANIELIQFSAFNDITFGLINAGQLQSITNADSTGDVTVTGIAAGAALGVQNINGTDTTFNYLSTAGTQAATLNVSTVTGNAVITIAGVETIDVNSQGVRPNVFNLDATSATTVTIAGSNDTDITGGTLTKATLIDASSLTGDLTANLQTAGTLRGGSGDDTLGLSGAMKATIHGGAGDDTIDVSNKGANTVSVTGGEGDDLFIFDTLVANTATSKNNDTIDGGEGTDVLQAGWDKFLAINNTLPGSVQSITNIEVLEAVNVTEGTLVTARVQPGIEAVDLTNGSTGDVGVTFDSGMSGTVLLGGQLGGKLTVAHSGSGASDVATVTGYSDVAIDFFNGEDVATTGTDTLVLDSQAKVAGTQTVGNITGKAGATAVAFTGADAFEIGEVTAGSVDASGLTGKAALTMTAASVGVTSITGSANGDVLFGQATKATTIDGGAGNDTITGGTGADLIIGGDGDDVIYTGGGADTVFAGAGDDIVYASAPGVDTKGNPLSLVIDTEDGDDVVVIASGGKGNITVVTGAGDDLVVLGEDYADVNLTIDLGAGDDALEVVNLDSIQVGWTLDGGAGSNVVVTQGSDVAFTNRDYIVLNEVLTNFDSIDFTSRVAGLDASKISNYKNIGIEGDPEGVAEAKALVAETGFVLFEAEQQLATDQAALDAADAALAASTAQLATDQAALDAADAALAASTAQLAIDQAALDVADAALAASTAQLATDQAILDAADAALAASTAQLAIDQAALNAANAALVASLAQLAIDQATLDAADAALAASTAQLATDQATLNAADAALAASTAQLAIDQGVVGAAEADVAADLIALNAEIALNFTETTVTVLTAGETYELSGVSIGGVAVPNVVVTLAVANTTALAGAFNAAFDLGVIALFATDEGGGVIRFTSTVTDIETQPEVIGLGGKIANTTTPADYPLADGALLGDLTLAQVDYAASVTALTLAEATRDAQQTVVNGDTAIQAAALATRDAQQVVVGADTATQAAAEATRDAQQLVVNADTTAQATAVTNLDATQATVTADTAAQVTAEATRDATQAIVTADTTAQVAAEGARDATQAIVTADTAAQVAAEGARDATQAIVTADTATQVAAEATRDAQQVVVDAALAEFEAAEAALEAIVDANESVVTKVAADQTIFTNSIVTATSLGHTGEVDGAAMTVVTEGPETFLTLGASAVTLSVDGTDEANGDSVTFVTGKFGSLTATLTNGQVIDNDGFVVEDTQAALVLDTSEATLTTTLTVSGSGTALVSNSNGSALVTVVSSLNGVSTVEGEAGDLLTGLVYFTNNTKAETITLGAAIDVLEFSAGSTTYGATDTIIGFNVAVDSILLVDADGDSGEFTALESVGGSTLDTALLWIVQNEGEGSYVFNFSGNTYAYSINDTTVDNGDVLLTFSGNINVEALAANINNFVV